VFRSSCRKRVGNEFRVTLHNPVCHVTRETCFIACLRQNERNTFPTRFRHMNKETCFAHLTEVCRSVLRSFCRKHASLILPEACFVHLAETCFVSHCTILCGTSLEKRASFAWRVTCHTLLICVWHIAREMCFLRLASDVSHFAHLCVWHIARKACCRDFLSDVSHLLHVTLAV
jgi:hypothetical protein